MSTQLKKGVLDLCVLALLEKGDSYAYDISRNLAKAVDMREGTIYPLMRRLEAEGLIESYMQASAGGPSRKYYRLKPAGQASLRAQISEWKHFVESVNQVLGANA
ncbi:PadR family transcriptional regulator [Pandoraea anapnoica]|uniref:PadR family transcriptional regulator n=1 Tax=Pandoraea anapnoica TaxID=2508301 RepID=UPI001C2D3727|nr:PadR family transcriptional regulator [Pandoraea anapnoica]